MASARLSLMRYNGIIDMIVWNLHQPENYKSNSSATGAFSYKFYRQKGAFSYKFYRQKGAFSYKKQPPKGTFSRKLIGMSGDR